MEKSAKTALVIDDEPAVQTVVKRALEPLRYKVLCAFDGEEGLLLAAGEKPDVIVLDIAMPGKNGREVLRQLRAHNATRLTPVVMLTSAQAASVKVQSFEFGADDYVVKPFDVREFQARVEAVVRRSRRQLSANPLTQLPGSPEIEAEIARRVNERRRFAVIYADIDHFKAYNDAVGVAKADEIIVRTAQLLVDVISAGADGFVGHVGGDDFVALTDTARADAVAQQLAERFDALAMGPMTLSIAACSSERRDLSDYGKAMEILGELKQVLKSRADFSRSAWIKDRRSGK